MPLDAPVINTVLVWVLIVTLLHGLKGYYGVLLRSKSWDCFPAVTGEVTDDVSRVDDQ